MTEIATIDWFGRWGTFAIFQRCFPCIFSIYSARTVYRCGLIERKLVQCAVQRFKLTTHSGEMGLQVHIYSGTDWETSVKMLKTGHWKNCSNYRKISTKWFLP